MNTWKATRHNKENTKVILNMGFKTYFSLKGIKRKANNFLSKCTIIFFNIYSSITTNSIPYLHYNGK